MENLNGSAAAALVLPISSTYGILNNANWVDNKVKSGARIEGIMNSAILVGVVASGVAAVKYFEMTAIDVIVAAASMVAMVALVSCAWLRRRRSTDIVLLPGRRTPDELRRTIRDYTKRR